MIKSGKEILFQDGNGDFHEITSHIKERFEESIDFLEEYGYVVKPKNGWYQARNPANDQELSGNVRAKQTLQKSFWAPVFENTDFAQHIEKRFKVGTVEMVTEEDDDACE